jgi:hypothetical protein
MTTRTLPSPPQLQPAIETSLVTDRLQVLNALRTQLETSISADRLHWRTCVCQLLAIYKEIEDCCASQVLAPYQASGPQDLPARDSEAGINTGDRWHRPRRSDRRSVWWKQVRPPPQQTGPCASEPRAMPAEKKDHAGFD